MLILSYDDIIIVKMLQHSFNVFLFQAYYLPIYYILLLDLTLKCLPWLMLAFSCIVLCDCVVGFHGDQLSPDVVTVVQHELHNTCVVLQHVVSPVSKVFPNNNTYCCSY